MRIFKSKNRPFHIVRTGPSGITYSRGEKRTFIGIELLADCKEKYVYFDDFKTWGVSTKGEPVTDEEKAQAKSDINEWAIKNKVILEWE